MHSGTQSTTSPAAQKLSLRFLKSRGAHAFHESRDAIREAVMLRYQYLNLRERINRGLLSGCHVTPPSPPAASPLTAREMAVLRLITEGKTTKEIAAELNIAFKTAAAHRAHIMDKLEVSNSAGVVREAYRLGLLNGEL